MGFISYIEINIFDKKGQKLENEITLQYYKSLPLYMKWYNTNSR